MMLGVQTLSEWPTRVGSIALQQMSRSDIPAAMRLKDAAGWNQTVEDWEMYLHENAAGCFLAVCQDRVVGSITSVSYENRVAWIGMMLVDPSYRRLGIATRLMQQAIASLSACPCIKLDATPAGKKVYDGLGFVDEYGLDRFALSALGTPVDPAPGIARVSEQDLTQIEALDRSVFGASRRGILTSLLKRTPGCAWKAEQHGRVCGFCLGRPGAKSFQIGPLVALDVDTARGLVAAALGGLQDRPVVMDVPTEQDAFRNWLGQVGFVEQRSFMRMVLGHNVAGTPAGTFAICGPELG